VTPVFMRHPSPHTSDPLVCTQVCRSGKPAGTTALWSALIIIFPLIGVAVWAACGPRAVTTTTSKAGSYGGATSVV
jgi:hypothetical protein